MKKKLYSFLLAAFLATTSMFAADITTGLKMHYTFEGVDTTLAGDTVILDQSGNKNDISVIKQVNGQLSFGQGYGTGNAVFLGDTLKGTLKLKDGIVSDVKDFTISCWVNQNDYSQWGRIFDFGNNTTQYMFLTCTDKKFRFAIKYNDAMGEDLITAPFILSPKQWIHIAVTGSFSQIDETDTVSTVKLYVDGMLAGTSSDFVIAPYMLGNTTYNVIGDSQWADPFFNGRLDDFRFYTRALSEEDLFALHGYTPALIDAYNNFTMNPDDLFEIMPGSTLTLPAKYNDVDITWATSDSLVIKKDGTPIHGEFEIMDAKLTATLSIPGGPSIDKVFDVSVYPINPPVENLAVWNFTSDKIVRRNDTIFVGDEGEVGFTAYTVGGAQIVPIGAAGGTEGVDMFNVLSLGPNGGQWLELDRPIGEYIYKLGDYSVSLFFRKDTTIDHKTWSDYGQLLYAFGNSQDLVGQAYGAMYFEPKRARHVCTPSNYGNEDPNKVGVGENQMPLGNTWHNVTYIQTRGTGSIYIDGVFKVSGAMPAPKVALKTNTNVKTRTGTWYNRLGGKLYTGDVTAKNTMMYGFNMFSIGLSGDDLEGVFDITNKIEALNAAMAATTYDINAYMASLPLMNTARKTLAIGYLPAAADLTAALNQCRQDSIDMNPTAEHVQALSDAIATYNELSADWIAIGKTLKTFDDEIAMGYPGLATFQAAIATAQAAYGNYEVDAETIAVLDEAVLTYYKSQVATSTNAANYNWVLTNPGFETGITGGTKLAGSSSNGAFNLPKGWNCIVNTAGWVGCNYYTSTPTEAAKCYEVWSGGAFTEVDFSQITTQPLEAGYYVLSGDVRTTGAAQAGTQHVYVITAENTRYSSDSLNAGWDGGHGWSLPAWKKVFTVFYTAGGKATVGFRANNVIQMDNMKLAYFGATAPAAGDVTSLLKNPGFEEGANATELEGFDANTAVKADLGDLFAPKSWSVLANVDTTANASNLNVITVNPTEGSKAYQMFADTVKNFKLYQKFYSPSSGVYRLTADVRSDSSYKSDARLFVKAWNRTAESKKLMALDTLKDGNAWKSITVEFRAAVADPIELGVMASGNVQVDNFKMEMITSAPLAIKGTKAISNKYSVYAKDGVIHISGLTNERVSVYDIAGRQISVKDPSQIKVSKGLYLIKINNDVMKQLVK